MSDIDSLLSHLRTRDKYLAIKWTNHPEESISTIDA